MRGSLHPSIFGSTPSFIMPLVIALMLVIAPVTGRTETLGLSGSTVFGLGIPSSGISVTSGSSVLPGSSTVTMFPGGTAMTPSPFTGVVQTPFSPVGAIAPFSTSTDVRFVPTSPVSPSFTLSGASQFQPFVCMGASAPLCSPVGTAINPFLINTFNVFPLTGAEAPLVTQGLPVAHSASSLGAGSTVIRPATPSMVGVVTSQPPAGTSSQTVVIGGTAAWRPWTARGSCRTSGEHPQWSDTWGLGPSGESRTDHVGLVEDRPAAPRRSACVKALSTFLASVRVRYAQMPIHPLAFANALAITSALLAVLLAMLTATVPSVFVFVFNAQFFGADVASLLPAAPSLARITREMMAFVEGA